MMACGVCWGGDDAGVDDAGRFRLSASRVRVVLALLGVAWFLTRGPSKWEADSVVVYDGVFDLVRWLKSGVKVGAVGPRGGWGGVPDIGPFPVFQYASGMVGMGLRGLGVPVNLFYFWAACSSLGLLGLVGLMLRRGWEVGAWGAGCLMAAVVLCGPMVAYGESTFNEVPAAFLTALFVYALTAKKRRMVWVGLLFVVAGLTKEIAVPILAVFWVGVLGFGWRSLVGLGVASLVAMSGHWGFNWFRYGTIFNAHYLGTHHVVPYLSWRLEQVVGLLVAPNGGVFVFWPAMLVGVGVVVRALTAGAGGTGKNQNPKSEGGSKVQTGKIQNESQSEGTATDVKSGTQNWRMSARRSAWVVLAAFAVVVAGLSAWAAPFGWWCWGPRLVMPYVPAMLLVLLSACGGAGGASEWVRSKVVGSGLRVVVAAVVAGGLVLPHGLEFLDPSYGYKFFEEPEPIWYGGRVVSAEDAPKMPAADDRSEEFPARQHFAIRHEAWAKRPLMLWRPLRLLGRPGEAWPVGVLVGAVVLLVVEAGRGGQGGRGGTGRRMMAEEG